MTITVSQLKGINTLDISYVSGDFANASSWYGDALESFATDVLGKVDSESVWSGGGQSDAAMVMSINRSALNIGKIEMDAASKIMDALYSALSSAQGYLLTSLFEADQKKITVHDDGSASYDHVTTVCAPRGGCFPDGDSVAKQNDAKRIQREVQGYLVFATVADMVCMSVLDRIASHTPVYSSTADPGALAMNMDTLENATDDQILASNNQKFWNAAYPKPLPEQPSGWDEFWHGVGNFFSHLADHAGELAIEGGSMVTGGLLMALGGGVEVGGVALDATGVGAVVGVPANVLGAGVIATGATTAGLGALAMANTVGDAASESSGDSSGEPASTRPEPPRYRPGDNKVRSRTYGKSTADVKGQANNYAKGMEKRGYKVDVPPVRYGKYGPNASDVTVAVYKKTGELVAIRHFIYKG